MEIIALAHSKGGTGKTTTVFNLGSELSRRKKNVLLLDMDPQASLTMCFKHQFKQDQLFMEDLLATDRLDPCKAPVHIGDFLDIIPATSNLGGVELFLTKDPLRLKKLIHNLTQLNYDYVLIDAPGTTDIFMVAVLSAATEVIIPVRPGDLDCSALLDFKKNIDKISSSFNPTLEIRGLLFNQVITSSKNHKVYRDFLGENELGKKLLGSQIRMATAILNSPSFGKDIGLTDPKSEAAKDYRNLADEVISWHTQV